MSVEDIPDRTIPGPRTEFVSCPDCGWEGRPNRFIRLDRGDVRFFPVVFTCPGCTGRFLLPGEEWHGKETAI